MPVVLALAVIIVAALFWLIHTLRDNAVWVDVYYTHGNSQEASNLHADLEEHNVRCRLRIIGYSTDVSKRLFVVRVHSNDLRASKPLLAAMRQRRERG